MSLTFDVTIEGREIRCEVGSDTAIAAPVFCCSNFVPSVVVSGGVLVRSVAGYTEVALPDIPAGGKVAFVMAYREPGFRPRNRAWWPLGSYLRTKAGVMELPPVETGVRVKTAPPRVVPEFAGLKLVPQPSGWTPAVGTVRVVGFACGDGRLAAVDELARRLNFAPFLAAGGVSLVVREAAMEAGAYEITLRPEGVEVVAGGDLGLHHAAITLLNLRETYGGDLPCGTIRDAPRFGWRGQHLDCARHFYEVGTILRLLDLMALVKLNRFHWHFSDDEAFRVEVSCAPELWQKTAIRGEGCLVPGVYGGGVRAGGSYSRADVARILERAAALKIEVLPEIEVPAHGYALNIARGGMRDPGDNSAAVSVHGYLDNTINPAMPETWKLVEPLALEVAGMFPIGILHLGCDELPPAAWSASPAVERLKAEHGLTTRDDVQGWMMERLAGFLERHGIRSAAWEEAARAAMAALGMGRCCSAGPGRVRGSRRRGAGMTW